MSDSIFSSRELLRDLVALAGPPGQEAAVRGYVQAQTERLGLNAQTDAKGNLLVSPVTGAEPANCPTVVVTAHLDEIALLVSQIEPDGTVRVVPHGGVQAWKWGEGPVEILARDGVFVPGVLGFGSIHTTAPQSVIQQARDGVVPAWGAVEIFTGFSAGALQALGVRPGSRVVIARSRRALWDLGSNQEWVSSYFLDDRADLVAWLLALEALKDAPGMENVVFAATTSEEVGGEGALFLLHEKRPPICVALEIGPSTPDAFFPLDANPTVWVNDSYAAMEPRDLDILDDAAREIGLSPHFQAVTRGGSDASCAASHGLCARPVTLAFAAANSHGFEIMHRDAPVSLARLLEAYLKAVTR